MKNIMIILFCFLCITIIASTPRIYENYNSDVSLPPTKYYPRGQRNINSRTYSFKLIKKRNNKFGYFTPIVKRYIATTYNSRNATHEESTIVIINYDLSKMVDNDYIVLKDNQQLFPIGTYTSENGKTYRVYSFNENDKFSTDMANKLNNNNNNNINKQSYKCPYCHQEIIIQINKNDSSSQHSLRSVTFNRL